MVTHVRNQRLTNGRKTEIAIEYCYRIWSKQPSISIYWVSCDSLTKIELAFNTIARRLDLPGHEDVATDIIGLVSRQFEHNVSRSWLLVLDNADDIELITEGQGGLAQHIRKFRGGSVIVTTRDRYVAQAFVGTRDRCLLVDRLTPTEALTLLRSKLPGDVKCDETVELQILKILEYLPLCITQAAAYIDRSNIGLQELLLELTESESSLMEALSEDNIDIRRGFDTPNSVLRTWKISFDKIRQRYGKAGRLLSIMAFLDRQCIERSLLDGVLESRHELNLALGTLQGFCLIVAEASATSFRMHRLVQLATIFWLYSKKSDYEALALEIVAAGFCAASEDPIAQARLIPHAKLVNTYHFQDRDTKLRLAGLQHHIAAYDLRIGHYDEAAGVCQPSYETRSALLGPSAIDTLHSAGLLGKIKRYQGQFDKACALQQEVLERKEAVLGAEHLDTINTISDLADAFDRQWQLDKSRPLAERALAIHTKILGEDHHKTLDSLVQLAAILKRQTQYSEAEVRFRKALNTYRRTLPEYHESTLKCANSLASLLRDSGRSEEAVQLGKFVVEGRKQVQGEDHPQTLTALNNLALNYWRAGHLETAERLARSVCASHERYHRQDHIDALQAYSNLSLILRVEGKVEEAEKYGRHALAGRKQVLGCDHLVTIFSAAELARTLVLKAAYREAEDLVLLVLRVRKERLGEQHKLTLNTLFTLGVIQQYTGRRAEAEETLCVVYEGRLKLLGQEHDDTSQVVNQLSSLKDGCSSGPPLSF